MASNIGPVLGDSMTFAFLRFKCKVTDDGPVDPSAKRQWQEVIRHAEDREHWNVFWAHTVGTTHEAVLITGKAFLCGTIMS